VAKFLGLREQRPGVALPGPRGCLHRHDRCPQQSGARRDDVAQAALAGEGLALHGNCNGAISRSPELDGRQRHGDAEAECAQQSEYLFRAYRHHRSSTAARAGMRRLIVRATPGP
jgi:hypothetical protein